MAVNVNIFKVFDDEQKAFDFVKAAQEIDNGLNSYTIDFAKDYICPEGGAFYVIARCVNCNHVLSKEEVHLDTCPYCGEHLLVSIKPDLDSFENAKNLN